MRQQSQADGPGAASLPRFPDRVAGGAAGRFATVLALELDVQDPAFPGGRQPLPRGREMGVQRVPAGVLWRRERLGLLESLGRLGVWHAATGAEPGAVACVAD